MLINKKDYFKGNPFYFINYYYIILINKGTYVRKTK